MPLQARNPHNNHLMYQVRTVLGLITYSFVCRSSLKVSLGSIKVRLVSASSRYFGSHLARAHRPTGPPPRLRLHSRFDLLQLISTAFFNLKNFENFSLLLPRCGTLLFSRATPARPSRGKYVRI
jgi:hypothetical protein